MLLVGWVVDRPYSRWGTRFLSVPWSTFLPGSFGLINFLIFNFFLNTCRFSCVLPLSAFFIFFFNVESCENQIEFVREIHQPSNLLLPHIRIPYIQKNPRFILNLRISFFPTEQLFNKKGKKNMRSSIFLVVPFAAVALGQVVRFSILFPFHPLQTLFRKYILQTPKYQCTLNPLDKS